MIDGIATDVTIVTAPDLALPSQSHVPRDHDLTHAQYIRLQRTWKAAVLSLHSHSLHPKPASPWIFSTALPAARASSSSRARRVSSSRAAAADVSCTLQLLLTTPVLGGLTGGGGIGDKLNGMAGGGAQGEKNEDYLDKGVDFVQERFMGGGAQNNESAAEQAKVGYFINVADKQDEMISDAIRSKYKGMVGSDFPVADKQQGFGGMGGQQQ